VVVFVSYTQSRLRLGFEARCGDLALPQKNMPFCTFFCVQPKHHSALCHCKFFGFFSSPSSLLSQGAIATSPTTYSVGAQRLTAVSRQIMLRMACFLVNCPPRSTRVKAQNACVLRPPERGGAGCQLIRPCQARRPPLGLQVPYALYSERQAVKTIAFIMSQFSELYNSR